MCYSNCPYENYHGECTQPKMMGTKGSHCWDGENEENEKEYEEYDEDRFDKCGGNEYASGF